MRQLERSHAGPATANLKETNDLDTENKSKTRAQDVHGTGTQFSYGL
jgi:hypothetical protein